MASSLALRGRTLPHLLSKLPFNGRGSSVFPSTWAAKGFDVPSPSKAAPANASRWVVEKVQLRPVHSEGGTTKYEGKAFGVLYWRGKRVTPEGRNELIPGAMKHEWMLGQLHADV